MQVEVLYFDGRPTYREVEKTLRGMLDREDAEADVVELVAVNTDEEAQRLRFPGSPTGRRDDETPTRPGLCPSLRRANPVVA